MSDPLSSYRLDRIEASQADLSARIGRIESALPSIYAEPAAGGPPARPATDRSGVHRWATVALWILVGLAALWFIDELPGPNLLDRLF